MKEIHMDWETYEKEHYEAERRGYCNALRAFRSVLTGKITLEELARNTSCPYTKSLWEQLDNITNDKEKAPNGNGARERNNEE